MSHSISLLLPQIVLAIVACLMLIDGKRRKVWGLTCLLALVAAAACLGLTTSQFQSGEISVSATSIIVMSQFGIVFQWVTLGVGFLVVLMTFSLDAESATSAESYGLTLLVIIGAMCMCVANHLIAMLLAFELVSISLAVLIFRSQRSDRELRQVASDQQSIVTDSASRFFIWNASVSVAMFLGCGLIFAVSGTTNLSLMHANMQEFATSSADNAPDVWGSSLGTIGVVLVLVGLCVRMWAIPGHFILADIYEANRSWVNVFVTTLVSLVAFVATVRLLVHSIAGLESTGQVVAMVLALVTMTFGHVHALTESRIRKQLAFLTTAQFGIVLAGLAAGFWNQKVPELTQQMTDGIQAAILSVITIVVSLVGIHAVLVFLADSEREVEHREELSGLIRHHPLAATILTVSLLSLMGIPPLAGFWSRLFVVTSIFDVRIDSPESQSFVPMFNFLVLGLFVVVNCVLTIIVGVRLLILILFQPPAGRREASGQAALAAGMLAGILSLAIGHLPGPLLGVLQTIESPVVTSADDE